MRNRMVPHRLLINTYIILILFICQAYPPTIVFPLSNARQFALTVLKLLKGFFLLFGERGHEVFLVFADELH